MMFPLPAQVLDFLKETGFVLPFNRPLEVNHTACRYPEVTSPTLTRTQLTGKQMTGRWFQVLRYHARKRVDIR